MDAALCTALLACPMSGTTVCPKAGIAAPGEAPDVFNLVPEYNHPRRFRTLADDLAHRGWTSGRIEKILGRNFARLFAEVWKS